MLIYSFIFLILLHSTALSVGVTERYFDQESCLMTNEMEEECSAACYPSIKPLYNLVATCQDNDKTLIQLQNRLKGQDIEMSKLKAQAESLRTQKRQLTDEINSCGPHIIVEEALQQVLLLQNQFNSELNNLRVTVKDTEEVLAALLQEKLDRIKVIESLESQLAGNATQMKEINTRLSHIAQMEELLKQRTKSIVEREKEINQIETKLKQKESLAIKDKSIKEKEAALNRTQESLKNIEKSLNDTEASLLEKNKNVETLLDKMYEMLETLKTKADTKNEEAPTSETDVDEDESSTASSCRDFEDDSNGIGSISVPGIDDPFEVLCDSNIAGSGWIVIHRRINWSMSFNRSWSEYKEGFGSLHGDFFIGLEKIYRLTEAKPHELFIEKKKLSYYYAKFDNFKVGSEGNGYILESIGKSIGNKHYMQEMIRNQVGMKFLTYDRDRDNIARRNGAGWWYNSALESIFTYSFMQKALKLGYIRMMIREKLPTD